MCIALLTSCALPNSVVQGSPVASSTPDSASRTPNSTPGVSQNAIPSPVSLETQSVSPSPNNPPEEAVLTPVEPVNETTHYSLDVLFDYYRHSLWVTESIKYTNSNPDALIDLVLVVEANLRTGAFKLDSLTWEMGDAVINYDFAGNQLLIPLPQPLAPGDGLGLRIRYSLEIPKALAPSESNRPVPFGYTERQTNIVDWYPYIPPYQTGDGWLVHQSGWFGEHQVYDKADFDVTLTLAEPVQDLVIAASAPVQMDGQDTFVYHLESARTFALSASHEFVVHTTEVGEVTVFSYSFPFHEYAGEEALYNSANALELFSHLIMPYPHSTLSVVEADFLDGMEYDGLYFLSYGFYNLYDGTPQSYLTFIAAHETAHQWWYGLIGNDQALEPWLDEAMCTYMEHIFYEYVYADYKTSTDLSMIDWWWYYRVNFYDPDGWVNGAIYDYDRFRSYRDAVYLNGAKFLDDLRKLIGDEAFFSFLREYANENMNRIATADVFFDILENNTSKNLDQLINKYFQAVK
jgi:hypothetical protein